MSFDRELGTTVRKEHILQIIKAWEGDESYGVPLALTAVSSSASPALSVRNRSANGVGLLVRNSSDTGDLLRVTDSGAAFSFQPGSINGSGVVTPSITLGGDSDTGFWHPGGNDNNGNISIASQGAEIERWTPTAHTVYLPTTIDDQSANADGLSIKPVNASGASQAGPRLVLQATALSGATVNARDFILRVSTTAADGSGKLEVLTRLNGGAETVVMSLTNSGTLSDSFSTSVGKMWLCS